MDLYLPFFPLPLLFPSPPSQFLYLHLPLSLSLHLLSPFLFQSHFLFISSFLISSSYLPSLSLSFPLHLFPLFLSPFLFNPPLSPSLLSCSVLPSLLIEMHVMNSWVMQLCYVTRTLLNSHRFVYLYNSHMYV